MRGGGGQAQFLMKEKKRLKGFTYVWEQADFDPVTNHILCKIHFEFKDRTRLKNAFVYDWRLWSLVDFEHPDVEPRLLAIIEEVLQNYDVTSSMPTA